MLIWFTIAFAGERPGVILADPKHPLVVACKQAMGDRRVTECVERTARRDMAAAEVGACAKLDDEKARVDCVVRLERRGKLDASAAITACAETFSNSGLACTRATEEAQGDLGTTITACSELFSDDKRAIGCVSQFVTAKAPSGDAVRACEKLHSASEKCLGVIATAAGPMQGVIAECRLNHTNDADALKCVGRFTAVKVDATAGIKACGEAFAEGDKCLDAVARASAPMEGTVAACRSTYEDDAQALKCVSGFVASRHDGGPAILACSALGDYRDECITRVGTARPAMGGIVEACAKGLQGKLAMKCVAMLVDRQKAKAESVSTCMSLFEDAGERLKCTELAHHKKVEMLEKCREWENGRMNCVQR